MENLLHRLTKLILTKRVSLTRSERKRQRVADLWYQPVRASLVASGGGTQPGNPAHEAVVAAEQPFSAAADVAPAAARCGLDPTGLPHAPGAETHTDH